MSDAVSLTLRALIDAPLEVDGLTPDRVAALSERDIAALPVLRGNARAAIGDFFDVHGERSRTLRIVGDVSRVDGLGAAMTGGELIIDGNAGSRVGARMSDGSITVTGRVGDEAGASMSGGLLRIHGDAGARLGAATAGAAQGMSGGEIIVDGSSGAGAAARLRRGVIVVGGDAGDECGRAMIAGTLIVLGRTGAHPGRQNKRGSIVAIGGITIPPTYRYACPSTPPHLRFAMTYLRRRHGLAIPDDVVGGLYRRYCGDLGDPGKGEILEWVAS